MGDGTEFDDALLGLRGFRVLAVTEDGDELLVGIETIRRAAGCPSCGVIARTGPTPGDHQGPAGLRPARAACLVQATVLLPRAGLPGPDLDRALRRAPRSPRAVRPSRT